MSFSLLLFFLVGTADAVGGFDDGTFEFFDGNDEDIGRTNCKLDSGLVLLVSIFK